MLDQKPEEPPGPPPEPALPKISDPAFEDLVFRLLELREDHGEGVLEQLCSSHPEMAARLRARLGELDAGGLLDSACDDGPWPLADEGEVKSRKS